MAVITTATSFSDSKTNLKQLELTFGRQSEMPVLCHCIVSLFVAYCGWIWTEPELGLLQHNQSYSPLVRWKGTDLSIERGVHHQFMPVCKVRTLLWIAGDNIFFQCRIMHEYRIKSMHSPWGSNAYWSHNNIKMENMPRVTRVPAATMSGSMISFHPSECHNLPRDTDKWSPPIW